MAKTIKYFTNGIELTEVSADPVSPNEGDFQYSDGTARAKGVWQYKDGAWISKGEAGIPDLASLGDTQDLTGQAGKVVKVNITEDGFVYEDVSAGAVAFTDLTDSPATFTAQANKLVAVKAAEDGVEFVDPPSTDFASLTDTPGSYSGQSGKVPSVNVGETALEFVDFPSGVTTHSGLSDTPSSYTGEGTKLVRVNVAEDAVEFVAPTVEVPILTSKTKIAMGAQLQVIGSTTQPDTSVLTNVANRHTMEYSRVGEFLEIRLEHLITDDLAVATPGGQNTGVTQTSDKDYLITLPDSLQFDSSVAFNTDDIAGAVGSEEYRYHADAYGYGTGYLTSNVWTDIKILPWDATRFRIVFDRINARSSWAHDNYGMTELSPVFTCSARLPIDTWTATQTITIS